MEDLLKLANELMANESYKSVGGFEDYPDGNYHVNIDKVELKMAQQTGNRFISFGTTILDGDYAEKKMFFSYFLTDKTAKRTLSTIMNILTSFGYELNAAMFQDYDTLISCLQALVGSTGVVEKKTNGQYANYTLRGDK